MFEKLWSSLFDKSNGIFISFGLGLSNDGSDLFFTFRFLWILCFYWIIPFFILCCFYISPHCYLFSYLFCYIHDQNFARGSPLFSFFLVYARIRISTREVKVNTQQVLAVSDRTGKPLRLHRPIRVASCLPDFVYRTVWLIPESRLVDWAVYPCRNSKRSFWANAKAPTSSSSINVFPVHSWPP